MIARPPVYRYPHQQLETGTRYDHWAQYGPPPAVPASLYRSQPYESPNEHAGPSRQEMMVAEVDGERRYSKGRDYLRSLGDQMASSELDRGQAGDLSNRLSVSDKPLPRLPPPPSIPHRPMTDPPYRPHPEPAEPPINQADVSYESPQKTFRPSPYLVLPENHRNPYSDPSSSFVDHRTSQPPANAKSAPTTPRRGTRPSPESRDIIELSYSPSSSSSSPVALNNSSNVTPRSPARIRKRAISEQPPTPSSTVRSPHPKDNKEGRAVRCAGYTRTGQPCKRLVKASAPLLMAMDLNVLDSNSSMGLDREKGEEVEGRYCKDHAGMICSQKGFYSRDSPGVWVDFDGESSFLQ